MDLSIVRSNSPNAIKTYGQVDLSDKNLLPHQNSTNDGQQLKQILLDEEKLC